MNSNSNKRLPDMTQELTLDELGESAKQAAEGGDPMTAGELFPLEKPAPMAKLADLFPKEVLKEIIVFAPDYCLEKNGIKGALSPSMTRLIFIIMTLFSVS